MSKLRTDTSFALKCRDGLFKSSNKGDLCSILVGAEAKANKSAWKSEHPSLEADWLSVDLRLGLAEHNAKLRLWLCEEETILWPPQGFSINGSPARLLLAPLPRGSMSVTNIQTCEWSNIVGLTRVTVSLLKGAPRFVERHLPSAWRSIAVDVCHIWSSLN